MIETTSCVGYICFVEEEGRSLTESAEARARQLAKKKKVSSLTLRLPLQILDLTQADCEEDLPFIPGPDSGNLTMKDPRICKSMSCVYPVQPKLSLTRFNVSK